LHVLLTPYNALAHNVMKAIPMQQFTGCEFYQLSAAE